MLEKDRNMEFGTAKSVPFIEVPSLQGVLIREGPLYYSYMYTFSMHTFSHVI